MHSYNYGKIVDGIFVKKVKCVNTNAFLAKLRANSPQLYKRFERIREKYSLRSAHILYHMFKEPTAHRCPTCGGHTAFIDINKGYRKYCCQECCNSDPAFREKHKKAQRRRWNNPDSPKGMTLDGQRFGGLTVIREVARANNRRRQFLCKCDCGNKTTVRMNHLRNGATRSCGCAHGDSIFNARRKRTWRKTLGVDHPMHDANIFYKKQRSGTARKTIKLDGKTFTCQGYEDVALRMLNRNYSVDRIETDPRKVPKIYYELEGKRRKYIPDIVVEDDKKIFEVKSTYTAGIKNDSVAQKATFKELKAKAEACRIAGYDFRCLIVDPAVEEPLVCGSMTKGRQFYVEKAVERTRFGSLV